MYKKIMIPEIAYPSQEETKTNYSKFFDLNLAPPDPETEELIRNAKPADPSLALRPGEFERMLAPGYLPLETGYCLMPDHTAYVAVLTKMPGLSLKMWSWFDAWMDNDLKYKIWCPGYHYRVRPGFLLEDIGRGPEAIYIGADITAQALGMAPAAIQKPLYPQFYRAVLLFLSRQKPRHMHFPFHRLCAILYEKRRME